MAEMPVNVVGPISDVEVIASGSGVRIRRRLIKQHGGHRWRKLKGVARVELPSGTIRRAELHWYEAHGVGRVETKIKRLLPEP